MGRTTQDYGSVLVSSRAGIDGGQDADCSWLLVGQRRLLLEASSSSSSSLLEPSTRWLSKLAEKAAAFSGAVECCGGIQSRAKAIGFNLC